LAFQRRGERAKVAALNEARQLKPLAADFCNKIGTMLLKKEFEIHGES
jgi:hypothetical protein